MHAQRHMKRNPYTTREYAVYTVRKSTQTPHDSAGDICGEKNVLDARKNSTPHMQHVHLGRSYAARK